MAVDLANWDRTSFGVFAIIIFVLLLPALLKWHYAVMILSWNTAITVFFLPGQPTLWMIMAGINFGIAILHRIIQKRHAFLPTPSITITLLSLLLVVVVTAILRGGIGSRAFGSTVYGGKGYYYIIAAVVGYFALVSQPISRQRATLYVSMFFLGGLVPAVSHLIYFAGPSFYFLYLIFPAGFAGFQAATEYSGSIVRIGGFWAAASAVSNYLMSIYGIRGILQRWWLGLLLLASLGLGAFGGFRSLLLLFGCIFLVLFLVEGLLWSPIFPAIVLIGALGFAAMVPFASKLPSSIQRTLSILPLDIDPSVRADAEGSWLWRLQMWKMLLPDLPKYIWLGKGYAIDPTDLYLASQAALRHRGNPYEGPIVAGDYHSGPLSVYMPFGSFGLLAFIAFLAASIRVLYLNWRYGAEELRILNRFLFAYFCGRTLFFFIVFGAIAFDLYHFAGTVGLSVALNNGVCRKPVKESESILFRGGQELGAVQSGAA